VVSLAALRAFIASREAGLAADRPPEVLPV